MIFYLQLFRRVAAALPGMDSTENKPPEDSILFLLFTRMYLTQSLLRNKHELCLSSISNHTTFTIRE